MRGEMVKERESDGGAVIIIADVGELVAVGSDNRRE